MARAPSPGGLLMSLRAQAEMAGFMFDGQEMIGGNFGGGDVT